MTYAGNRRIIDVDSHLFELDDFLHEVATPDEAALIAQIDEQTNLPVSRELIDQGRVLLERRRADVDTMKKFEESMFDASRSPWSRLGAFDPADRSHALDVLGFEQQWVLGTYSFHQIAHENDPKRLEVGARVMNRAITKFCADDERLVPLGYVPLSLGPELAGEMIDEAFELGCYSIIVDTNEPNPEARSFTHPDFDPVWARYAARDVPFVIHIAVNGHYDAVSPSFHNNGRQVAALGGDAPSSPAGFVAMNYSPELFLSAMVLDEVFERHDGLRCVSLEHGAAWVPGWLHKLDFVERSMRRVLPRQRSASEVARERVRVAPFANEPLGWIIDSIGPEMLVFASDYPHPEGSNDPIAKFEATLTGHDDDVLDRFFHGNILEFMGSSAPAPVG